MDIAGFDGEGPGQIVPVTRRSVLKWTGGTVACGLASGSAVGGETEKTQSTGRWGAFQYDTGNTGYAPGVEPPADAVASKWEFESGGIPVASPAVVDGTAYVPTEDGTLHAVALDSGEREWAFETTHDTATAPVVVGETVYVGMDATVYALAASDGTQQWSEAFSNQSVSGLDAVADGPVAVQTGEAVRAFAPDTGEERWRFEQDTFSQGSPLVTADGVYVVTDRLFALTPEGDQRWESAPIARDAFSPPSPASADGTVYAGGDGGTVFAFSSQSGDRLWEQSVESAPWEPPRLAADADGVYAAGLPPAVGRGTVTALAPVDGSQRWTIETAGNPMRPVVGDGSVYVGTPPKTGADGAVRALSVENGSEQWVHEADVVAAPTFGEDELYIGSGTGHLTAVETITGDARWRYATGGELATMPAVTGDAVYVGSEDNRVYSLSRASGAERWTFETERTVVDVACGDGTVYVGDEAGTVYALAPGDGTEQWRFAVEDGEPARFVVGDGTVFTKQGPSLYAVDAGDGTERWRTRFASALQDSAPALADGRVYVANGDDDEDDVFCFDAATGDIDWSANLGSGYPLVSAPVVTGGSVYVTGDETLVAFDAVSGSRRWERSLDGSFLAQPAVGAETVVVADRVSLYALRTRDGSTVWSESLAEPVTSPAVIAGEQVLVGTAEGTLYSRSFEDGSEMWSTSVDEQIGEAFAVVDGGVYLADGDGRMHAFEAAAAPSAAFTHSPETPFVGESVTFDASDSDDPDGTIDQYRWDLAGNGRLGPTGETPDFSYDEAGEYTVTLEVTDSQGMTATVERTVTVLEPTPTPTATPTVTPDPPATGGAGSGSDGDDGGVATDSPSAGEDGGDEGTSSGNGPGFGAVSALSALGVAALHRVRADDSNEE
ncbi:outer membrane protein assembly factor BamB family protein [Halosimplex sp. J119]